MKRATAKVWVTKDGKLVPDGDETAAFLVASKGMLIADSSVKKFGDDASKFFEDINPPHPEPSNVGVIPEDFKPGQSNSPRDPKGRPASVEGPVKRIGGTSEAKKKT